MSSFHAFSLRVNGKVFAKRSFLRCIVANAGCWLCIINSSCRLQGFPESFILPDDTGLRVAKQHRQRVSQFYKQIGNAVSPPCVAAVAEKTVEHLFRTSSPLENVNCPVHNILLQSCLNPDKVMSSIRRKRRLILWLQNFFQYYLPLYVEDLWKTTRLGATKSSVVIELHENPQNLTGRSGSPSPSADFTTCRNFQPRWELHTLQ